MKASSYKVHTATDCKKTFPGAVKKEKIPVHHPNQRQRTKGGSVSNQSRIVGDTLIRNNNTADLSSKDMDNFSIEKLDTKNYGEEDNTPFTIEPSLKSNQLKEKVQQMSSKKNNKGKRSISKTEIMS